MSFHQLRLQLERPPQLGDCARVILLLLEYAGELHAQVRASRVGGNGLLKLDDGVLRLRPAHLDGKPGADQTSLDRNSH